MPLRHRLLLLFLPFSAGCLRVRPESLLPPGASSEREQRSEFLDGQSRSLLVLGDASSLVWPQLLQEMLDAHAGKPGLYRVFDAAEDGARAIEWKAEEAGGAFDALSTDFLGDQARLRRRAPAPTIALCQVSLAGIGDERGPVKSEHDMVGAELGAEALQQLALELHDQGVEHVVFATSIYKEGAEPETGLERVALERLLARGHAFIQAGPDLHGPSRRYFPDAYQADRIQPNEFGMKSIAEEWYRWLAGPEAREDVVQALYAKDYDVEQIEREVRDWRARGPRP